MFLQMTTVTNIDLFFACLLLLDVIPNISDKTGGQQFFWTTFVIEWQQVARGWLSLGKTQWVKVNSKVNCPEAFVNPTPITRIFPHFKMKTALFCECKKEKNLPPLNKTLSVMVWSKEYVLSYIFEIKSSIFYLRKKSKSKYQNSKSNVYWPKWPQKRLCQIFWKYIASNQHICHNGHYKV